MVVRILASSQDNHNHHHHNDQTKTKTRRNGHNTNTNNNGCHYRRQLKFFLVAVIILCCCMRNIIVSITDVTITNHKIVEMMDMSSSLPIVVVDLNKSLPLLMEQQQQRRQQQQIPTPLVASSSSSLLSHDEESHNNRNNNDTTIRNDTIATTRNTTISSSTNNTITSYDRRHNNNNNNINNTKTKKPLPPFPWQWIHPMKTATSFANALYMLSCPDDYRGGNHWTEVELVRHSVLAEKGIQDASEECRNNSNKWINGIGFTFGRKKDWRLPRDTKGRAKEWWLGDHCYRQGGEGEGNNKNNTAISEEQLFVTMREPMDRILSQVHYQYGHQKKFQSMIQTDADMAHFLLHDLGSGGGGGDDDRSDHLVSPSSISILDSPRLAQQMTTLLFPFSPNGPFKAANVKTKEQLGQAACRVIEKVAWIGFADDYNRSICLLHHLFTVDFPHHPNEYINMRPRNKRRGRRGGSHRQEEEENKNNMTTTIINVTNVGQLVRNKVDILDDIVYGCARERFERDLKEYAQECL